MPTRSELEAAYRATVYRVYLPTGAVNLRIDGQDAGFAAWLVGEGATAWAILTAWNPGSQRLDEGENRTRQTALELRLLERGCEPYAGENVAEGGEWPVEESCLVLGLDCAAAAGLARDFGQNALVHGLGDGVPRLLWVAQTEGREG